MNKLKQHIYATIFLFCIGISVFIYGNIRCKKQIDPLIYRFAGKIDGWMVSHFIVYSIIGTLFPDTFIFSMIISVLWELFEYQMGYVDPKILKKLGFCDRRKFSDNFHENWWYGQYEDIICNFIGFIFGKYLLRPLIFK